ncbi:MAG: HEAT repeat domain-containing protein [Actinomycetota bacterium]
MTAFVLASGLGLVSLSALFVIWGALHDVVARRRRRRREAIVRLLTTVLFGDELAADRATRLLMRERRPSVVRALQELAVDLRGHALGRTRHLVDVLGIRTHIAAMARSRRRSPRIRAAELVSLVPDEATSSELLRDDDALVRALTVEALGASRLARRRGVIHELLCDPAQVVRATTQDTLIRTGQGFEEIASALADERTCGAALTVVSHIPDPNVVALALRHIDSPSPRRRALVAQALGNDVSADVSRPLATLMADEDARVREAAIRSAGVAGRGELSGALGHALSDRAWTVRHAAGEALSRFGPLGAMVLYGHLDDPDPYARDMAQRFVDLIEEGGGGWGRTVHVGFAPLAAT